MTQKLKKCPNCGRIPEVVIGNNFSVYVECECGETGDVGYRFTEPIPIPALRDFLNGAKKVAIMKWNNKINE